MFNTNKRIPNTILKSDIVSFDIFDTLICRNCATPTAIFDIVENRYNQTTNKKINNFKRARLEAGKKAKQFYNQEEVTIDEIYEQLEIQGDKELLKKIEYEVEFDYCMCNYEVKKIYDFAKENNKKIICVSDMYFDKDFLKKVLNNCGYKINDIYVSSEFRCKKSTGRLFKEIIKRNELKGKNIVHFGDAEKGDFIFPKFINIKTFLIRNKKEKKYISEKDIDMNKQNNSIIYSVIRNRVSSKNKLNNFGYEIIGPICLYFCFWIKNNTNKKDKRLFCARDMKIFNKFYDIIFPESKNQNIYFYVSRRSLRLPHLYINNNYQTFCDSMTQNKLTILEILKNLNLLDNNIINKLKIYDFETDKKYSKEELVSNNKFKTLYEDVLREKINNDGKEQYDCLNKYMESLKIKDYTVIDMGWKGTTQKLLIELYQKKKCDGLYFGIDSESKYNQINSKTAKGYLFFKNKNVIFDAQLKVYSCRDLFEKIFADQHGSTIKYKRTCPYYELEEIVENDLTRISIQNGALEFANDIVNYIKDLDLYDQSYEYVELLFNHITNPSFELSKLFGEITNDNMYERKIASPKSIIYYLIHIKELTKDLRESGWKVGFMRRLIGLKLPYYNIYKMLIERK